MVLLTLFLQVNSAAKRQQETTFVAPTPPTFEPMREEWDKCVGVAECHQDQLINDNAIIIYDEHCCDEITVSVIFYTKLFSNIYYHHFVGHCGAFCGLKWRILAR